MVIGRAATDSGFREALFAHPEETLAAYDLTDDEVARLKGMGAETLEALAGHLAENNPRAPLAAPKDPPARKLPPLQSFLKRIFCPWR